MGDRKSELIIGVLGQWASGKSTAADTLINYLGGNRKVILISDREILARHAVKHILESPESKVHCSIDNDGKRRLEGELATVYLDPCDSLKTIDLNSLNFDLHDEVYDNVPIDSYSWIDEARIELGNQIRLRSPEGKPVVIEAGFGTNTVPRGKNPFRHTISDLFLRLDEVGVNPNQVKWIIIEASYATRAVRNNKRKDNVPKAEFDRFAADGGDLAPAEQKNWEAQGATIFRVSNEDDDIKAFKADIIGACNELFWEALAETVIVDP